MMQPNSETQPYAIQCNALGKKFQSADTVGQESIIALDGLSLKITIGETVALIGSNGSGKSTLLSILSGIVRPTTGSVQIAGKITSILDIGSNFLPDLTGAQNARMFLTINGVTSDKEAQLIDSIRTFSELGEHFDYPLKTYSNGMYLRLAFATSFFLNADIYLVDEVINVGDQAFRLKIDLYFKKLKQEGKTLIIATHDTNAVLSLCDRCVWIENGRLTQDDKPSRVILEYAKFQQLKFQKALGKTDLQEFEKAILPAEGEDRLHHYFDGSEFGNATLQLMEVEVSSNPSPFIYRQEAISLRFVIEKKYAGVIIPQFKIRNEFNHPVLFSVSVVGELGTEFIESTKNKIGLMEFRCTIPGNWLSSGRYFLSLNFGKDIDIQQPIYNSRAYSLPNELCFAVRSREQEFISDPVHYSFCPELLWSNQLISEDK
jgi:ABC-type polysaccharide/polyol phosphate transport system ATPase subunit